MQTTSATPNEIKDAATFLARITPYLLDGRTFEEAGRAVIDRDRQLAKLAMSDTEQGQMIRERLAADVFAQAKIAGAADKKAIAEVDKMRRASLAIAGAA